MEKKNNRGMGRKRGLILVMLTFLSFALGACGSGGTEAVEHKTKDGHVGFLLKGFRDDEKQEAYALQTTDGHCYMNVWVDSTKELAEGVTKKDAYQMLMDDLLSKRENPVEFRPTEVFQEGKLTIYQTIYTAEATNEGKTYKNMYFFYLVDFGEDEDKFARVLFTTLPSYGEEKGDSFLDIVKTAHLLK